MAALTSAAFLIHENKKKSLQKAKLQQLGKNRERKQGRDTMLSTRGC